MLVAIPPINFGYATIEPGAGMAHVMLAARCPHHRFQQACLLALRSSVSNPELAQNRSQPVAVIYIYYVQHRVWTCSVWSIYRIFPVYAVYIRNSSGNSMLASNLTVQYWYVDENRALLRKLHVCPVAARSRERSNRRNWEWHWSTGWPCKDHPPGWRRGGWQFSCSYQWSLPTWQWVMLQKLFY